MNCEEIKTEEQVFVEKLEEPLMYIHRVLFFLAVCESTKINNPVSISDIHKRFGFTSAASTAHVDSLCDLGYIERIKYNSDRRKHYLRATKKGLNKAVSLRDDFVGVLEGFILI